MVGFGFAVGFGVAVATAVTCEIAVVVVCEVAVVVVVACEVVLVGVEGAAGGPAEPALGAAPRAGVREGGPP